MLAEIGSGERLQEWMEFEAIDGPLGSWREDYRAATIAMAAASAWGAKVSRQTFMTEWDRVKALEPQTLEDQILMAKRIAAMFGG